MCLGTKLSDRSLQRYKAKGKKTGYIRVWKRVADNSTSFKAWIRNRIYQIGLQQARRDAYNENHLIHVYRKSTYSQFDSERNAILISCLVHPDWIKAVSRNALTTKAIVMPEYPKTKVTVKEFRAAIKGKKVQKYVWE